MNTEPPKKRRGRRKKSEIENEKKTPNVPKRRGRKPKGGKLTNKDNENKNEVYVPENVILHLKCNISDIDNNINSKNEMSYNPEMPPEIKTYDILENADYTSYSDAPIAKDFDASRLLECNALLVSELRNLGLERLEFLAKFFAQSLVVRFSVESAPLLLVS